MDYNPLITKKQASSLVSERYFTVSARQISETWNLATLYIGRNAHYYKDDVIERAESILKESKQKHWSAKDELLK